MQTPLQSHNFWRRLLIKSGGWYTAIAIISAQVAASFTILLGLISERLNAEYSQPVSELLTKLDIIVMPIAFILQISVSLVLARKISISLSKWGKKPQAFEAEEIQVVWESSHTLIWKYVLSTAIISLCFVVLPRTFLLNSIKIATKDQVIYCLISGLISTLAFVPLSTVILDRLLIPVREVFLPKDFAR